MPTIKDIAKAAGVSHGTVSNVLNKKGNVSAEKAELVERIALQMGYNINMSAKRLRQGIIDQVDVIIPDNDISRYRDLYKSISQYASQIGFTHNLYITDSVPYHEKEIVKNSLSNQTHTIIIITCLNKEDTFYEDLKINDTNLIFVERKISAGRNPSTFYSFNAKKIGKNIAHHINQKNYRNIVYFSGRKTFTFERDIIEGINSNIDKETINIETYSCNPSLDIQTGFDIIFSNPNIDAIITTAKEKAEVIHQIIHLTQINLNAEIISLSSTDILNFSNLTQYEIDYKHLGKFISQDLLADEIPPTNIITPAIFTEKTITKTKNQKIINIACIKGLSEVALRYVSQIIAIETGIQANIISYDYEDLFHMIQTNQIDPNIDLMRIDMAWLSKFGKDNFIPLDQIPHNFDPIFDSFIDGLEQEYSYIDGKRYAFPFDPSMLLLFYRKDLFQDTIVSRRYFEQFKADLIPPRDFHSYNQIAGFFTKSNNAQSETQHGTTFIKNAPMILACEFLPIYYSLDGKFTQNGSSPYWNYDALRQALNLTTESLNYANVKQKAFWGDATRQFASGNTAMTITFSNRTSTLINSKISNVLGKYDFTTLPGQQQINGGGVLGISQNTQKIDTVFEFLQNLFSKRISVIFACLCGASSSKYVYENEDITNIYPWLKSVQDNLKNGTRRATESYFTNLDFEYQLGTILNQYINQTITIDEAIHNITTL